MTSSFSKLMAAKGINLGGKSEKRKEEEGEEGQEDQGTSQPKPKRRKLAAG
jgi:hypothetical protein